MRLGSADEGETLNAQPGWYDAGVPGMQRWWDGAQWTSHQREAIRPQFATPLAPMGWFPVVGTTDVRWWDGASWTPYRLRDDRPRPDALAIEPENTAVVLGLVFVVLSVTQFGTYSLAGQPFFAVTPVLFLLSGILWLIGGLRVGQLKKLPAPATMPVFDPSVRPLPGEVEGSGAGWFPVAGQVTRWWTGAQWSSYVGQKFGVRPTHSGRRAYRASMAVGWVFAGLGVLGTVVGIIVIGVLGRWEGLAVVIPAVIAVVIALLVLLLTHIRRFTLIHPPHAPQLP